MTGVMTEGYQSWVERVASGRENKVLAETETVQTAPPMPVNPIEFLRIERDRYTGEVGKRDGDYVFHFFPKEIDSQVFGNLMGDAFLETFHNSERIEEAWSDELQSWAVRARGYADNPLADELALLVFDLLDKKLGS